MSGRLALINKYGGSGGGMQRVAVGGADRLVGGCPALEEMRGRVKDVGQTEDL
jgi:hypothetical protein